VRQYFAELEPRRRVMRTSLRDLWLYQVVRARRWSAGESKYRSKFASGLLSPGSSDFPQRLAYIGAGLVVGPGPA